MKGNTMKTDFDAVLAVAANKLEIARKEFEAAKLEYENKDKIIESGNICDYCASDKCNNCYEYGNFEGKKNYLHIKDNLWNLNA